MLWKETLKDSVRYLFGRCFISQRGNEPKHKCTSENWHKDKIGVLTCPPMSSNLKRTEKLWQELKDSIHSNQSSNLVELKESGLLSKTITKRLKEICRRLVTNFRKHLLLSYWLKRLCYWLLDKTRIILFLPILFLWCS